MISSIIYYSERSFTCTEEEIQKILDSSNKNNSHKNITGILLYTDVHFIQYLEGDYNEIMNLCNVIKEDPRHSNFTFLDTKKEIERRIFPTWAMGNKRLDDRNVEFLNKMTKAEQIVFNALINGAISKSQEVSNLINLVLHEYKQVA